MDNSLKRSKCHLTREDIEKLSCFFYYDSNGFLETVFANFPLMLKRHCIQVGAVSGLMAMQVPESAIPMKMSREDYANAVRYGGLYHDIGAYLVYNHSELYPSSGERFLREQIGKHQVKPVILKIILETVRFCCERYDGQGYPDNLVGDEIPLHAGICGIANHMDNFMMCRKYNFLSNSMDEAKNIIKENIETRFLPAAAECLYTASSGIACLYKSWSESPPLWKHSDIRPLGKMIGQKIG